jgi:glutamine phosphoribosylpyrophosphate amidotransferase
MVIPNIKSGKTILIILMYKTKANKVKDEKDRNLEIFEGVYIARKSHCQPQCIMRSNLHGGHLIMVE